MPGHEKPSSGNDEAPPTNIDVSNTTQDDRKALIDRARAFLTSPQIIREDLVAKRKFLTEKGLTEDEVNTLIDELPPQLPPIPPRTYPQPPPSTLPNILIGVTRLLTWITGGSIFIILLYYRFILPRLTKSANARRSIKEHQVSLLTRLNSSLESLKSAQKETLSLLPKPSSLENPKYINCHSLKELKINTDSQVEIPEYTFIRCALEEFATADEKFVNVQNLFVSLEQRYPWLGTEEGSHYENCLWDTLTSSPTFIRKEEGEIIFYSYEPQSQTSPDTALLSSLDSLKAALPATKRYPTTLFQTVLESLADLTGYISAQTYSLSSSTFRVPGIGVSPVLSPQEEEVRREIRALKGLVLNRKSFTAVPRMASSMPSTPPETSS